MERLNLTSLILSTVVLTMGLINGFLLSLKILDDEPSHSVLITELIVAVAIFIFQIQLYFKGARSLNYHLKYLGSIGFSLSWCMMSFTFPLIMLETIPAAEKLVAGAFFCWVVLINVKLALRNFEKRWQEVGKQEFELQTKSNRNTVDWEKITYVMNIPIELLKPGVSERWHMITSVSMLLLLLIGGALSDMHPTLGMSLWTTPFLICAVCFFQGSAYRFAQARKVAEIERELGCALKSVVLPRRRRRAKKR